MGDQVLPGCAKYLKDTPPIKFSAASSFLKQIGSGVGLFLRLSRKLPSPPTTETTATENQNKISLPKMISVNLTNATFAYRKTQAVWGFPEGASIIDTVSEDMLEMIHPHWKKFPPVNPMWHYLLVSNKSFSHLLSI
jgi:hypothetical protein